MLSNVHGAIPPVINSVAVSGNKYHSVAEVGKRRLYAAESRCFSGARAARDDDLRYVLFAAFVFFQKLVGRNLKKCGKLHDHIQMRLCVAVFPLGNGFSRNAEPFSQLVLRKSRILRSVYTLFPKSLSVTVFTSQSYCTIPCTFLQAGSVERR